MNDILLTLVSEDFELKGSGRWLRSVEHSSLIVDTLKSKFWWNSKNINGDALDYLIKVRNLPRSVAEDILKYSMPSTVLPVNNSDTDCVPYPELLNTLHILGKSHRDYWYSRLLTNATIDLFQLGYYDGWYTVPIFKEGKLINFQKRRDIPEKSVHMWYRNGIHLFNSDIIDIFDTIYIAEGLIDAILLNQFGIPTISKTVGATSWKEEWSVKFYKTKQIFIVYDNDDAGREGAIKVANSIGKTKCKIYTFDNYHNKYDIVDFFRDGNSRNDFINLINTEARFSYERPRQ